MTAEPLDQEDAPGQAAAVVYQPRTSDHDIAANMLDRCKPSLRFATDAGQWIVRRADRWEINYRGAGGAVASVRRTLPKGQKWTGGKDDKPTPEQMADDAAAKVYARVSSDAGRRAVASTMADICDGTPDGWLDGVTVRLGDLDADPGVIWVPGMDGGQAYDLRTSTWRIDLANTPHLACTRYKPDPARPTPLWDAYVAQVWPDPDVRSWALTVLSVAYTGHAGKCLPILSGEADTGKTSAVVLLLDLLGSYGSVANAKLLAAAGTAHDSIVYALKGLRLAFIDEAPRTGTVAAERLKSLSGGGRLTGNAMRCNPVTFTPTHTLVLTCNPDHEPLLTDPAIASRVRLIPCAGDVSAVRAARAAIGDLDGPAWQNEAPGVLAAMLSRAGCYLRCPHIASNEAAPESIRQHTATLTDSQDMVLAWLENCERCEPGSRAGELYEGFVQTCKSRNVPASQIPTLNAWSRRLTKLGYPSYDGRGGSIKPLRVRLGPAVWPSGQLAGGDGAALR